MPLPLDAPHQCHSLGPITFPHWPPFCHFPMFGTFATSPHVNDDACHLVTCHHCSFLEQSFVSHSIPLSLPSNIGRPFLLHGHGL